LCTQGIWLASNALALQHICSARASQKQVVQRASICHTSAASSCEQVPLLHSLEASQLVKLATVMQQSTFKANDTIIKQVGDSCC
jgi:hypothetical protein